MTRISTMSYNNGKLISTSLATKMRMIELRQAVILRSYTGAHVVSKT